MDFYWVDVFAEHKLKGNQLAVFHDTVGLNTAQMQAIAKETNLAETTFITEKVADVFTVRIFTTEYEMPFAGHPTLGTAAVIAQKLLEKPINEVKLKLRIGVVTVNLSDNLYSFSLKNGHLGPLFSKYKIAASLGLKTTDIGSFPVQISSTGYPFLMVNIPEISTIKSMMPSASNMLDFLKSNQLHKSNAKDGFTVGIYCYTLEAEHKENQMHSRMFLVQDGQILEDPATGSAHTAFSHYAFEHKIFGESFKVRSEQGFEIGRPSILHIAADTNGNVNLGGKVQFVASGQWEV
jgi:trans-2,3-dihydro-3-hydroxyanthranilate isomerase